MVNKAAMRAHNGLLGDCCEGFRGRRNMSAQRQVWQDRAKGIGIALVVVAFAAIYIAHV